MTNTQGKIPILDKTMKKSVKSEFFLSLNSNSRQIIGSICMKFQ